MKKLLIFLFAVLFLALSVKPFLHWQNTGVGVTNYVIRSEKIPKSFDGYKLAVIADIQGAKFVRTQKFMDMLVRTNPDVLLFAGDLVDGVVKGSEKLVMDFLNNLKFQGDIYAIFGNHDLWTRHSDQLKKDWEAAGVVVLEDEKVTLTKNGEHIDLYGITDPDTFDAKKANERVENSLKKVHPDLDTYNVLLFHRANMLDMLNEMPFDLVLSGHMHGGQIRIPFIGGLRSPHMNWFPKYSGGKYVVGENTYIVSRGLGNTVSIPRLLNRPEIVVITLRSE